MNTIYSIRVRGDIYSLTILKYSKNQTKYISTNQYTSFDSIEKNLKNIKKISFILFENNFIKDIVAVNKNIKDESSLRSVIYSIISKNYIDIDNIDFKFNPIEKSEKKENIKYAVHGIYINTPTYKSISNIKSFTNCIGLTLDNYGLYSFSKKQYQDKGFIAIWADNNTLSICAGDYDDLYYSRNESISNSTFNLTQEIMKNILFIKQRVRELKIDIITINGICYEDYELFENIYNQAKIPVSTFIFNSNQYINFDIKTFNENLIDISNIEIPEEFNFTPKKIKANRQFNTLTNFIVLAMIVLNFFMIFNLYNNYDNYIKVNNQYENITQKYKQFHNDFNLDNTNIEYINKFIQLLKTTNNRKLIEDITIIKDNIKLLNSKYGLNLEFNFDNFNYSIGKKTIKNLDKIIEFKSLQDLNSFKNKLDKFKNSKHIEIKTQYDLNTLSIILNIKLSGV